jgi:hypothetical protein
MELIFPWLDAKIDLPDTLGSCQTMVLQTGSQGLINEYQEE